MGKIVGSQPHDQFRQHRAVQARSISDDEALLLHHAALEILERTGVRFHHPEVVDLMRKAGAAVSDGNRVRIPSHLVERALRSVPKNITIFDRLGRRAMSLGGYRSYFGVGPDAAHIYDLSGGHRRKAVLEDVAHGARLVDALPNLDFMMSQYLPSDVPVDNYQSFQMKAMLCESTKPIVFVGPERANTVQAIEMASAVAGGLEELVRYPFVVNYVNFVSPFTHNGESLERLVYAAERNLPSVYTPGWMRGSQVPMTEAGAIALVDAGQLAGLVVAQLTREGSPFIWAVPSGGSLDMNTMVSLYSAPDGGASAWDLAHFYQLPIFGFAGFADSKMFDAQAASEVSLTLFENALFGANLVHDIGLMDSGMTGSLEMVAFANDVIGWLRHYLRPLEISEDTLAMDLIRQVGPDGHFLDTEHTLRHVRDPWRPTLFDRRSFYHWSSDGALSLQARANRYVTQIVQNHRAEPLSERVQQALDDIITAAS